MPHSERQSSSYRHDELAALRRVATCVASRAELSEVYELVAHEAAVLVDAEGGSVMCLDDAHADSAVLVGAALRHHDTRVGCPVRISGGCAAARTLARGTPVRTEADHRTGSCCPADFACHTAVAAPVHLGGKLWGVVMAASEGLNGQPAPGSEHLLDEFAQLVALAVENAQLHAQLEASAQTDALTGLANRRSFDEQLEVEVERARRHDYPLSVALIDLDHFKAINDSAGHQAGDDVLARLARTLRAALRRGELLARVGGDELALILPGTDTTAALEAAARLQDVVARAGAGRPTDVSLSIGVCELADAADVAQLIRHADSALYAAKHAGGATSRSWRHTTEHVNAGALVRRHSQLALRALARAVDLRDAGTQRHSERVAAVAGALARSAGWRRDRVTALTDAAMVHDIGKVSIPDAILSKAIGLDVAEYELIKRHPVVGAEITSEIFDSEQVAWVRHHHERWDGYGYPEGLAGARIPLGARLLALADAWDVMVSERPYKQPLSERAALKECRRHAGTQFCPRAIELLESAAAGGTLPRQPRGAGAA